MGSIDFTKGGVLTSENGATLNGFKWKVTYRVRGERPSGGLKGLASKARKAAGREKKVNLDAGIVFFTGNEAVGHLDPDDPMLFGGAAQHTGDGEAAAGNAAFEGMTVNLGHMPDDIDAAMLAITAFGDSQAAGEVAEMTVTLMDPNDVPFFVKSLSIGTFQAKIVGAVLRVNGEWRWSAEVQNLPAVRGRQDLMRQAAGLIGSIRQAASRS